MSDETPTLIHDRYRMIRALGQGASARTLLVEDVESGAQYALKELRTERLEDWKHYELFEREVKTLQRLRHHGIPEVVDAFELEDEAGRIRLNLVQEYIEGGSLAEAIEQGKTLDASALMHVALGLLDVLDYLHTQAPPVFHRDIKPSNVMLRANGSPVLIDFGGVRNGWRPDDVGGSTVIGTHGYAPPEQYMGQISPASDLYALGATLLYAVGGRAPSEYDFSSGRIEVPEGMTCPPTIRRLIAACLEPAARDRPQSAREARDLLFGAPEDTRASERPSGGSGPKSLPLHPVVDPGPAPRQITPKNQGLYRSLVPQLTNGVGNFIFWYVFMGLFTLGLFPLIGVGAWWWNKRKYAPLFRDGIAVEGRVLSTSPHAQSPNSEILYEFEAEGTSHRSAQRFSGTEARYFAPGDAIVVLYDPNDPSFHRAVFDQPDAAMFRANQAKPGKPRPSERITPQPRAQADVVMPTRAGVAAEVSAQVSVERAETQQRR